MVDTIDKLKDSILQVSIYIEQCSEADLSYKLSPKKWSKKEILGHLVDSGLYNLQRFAEIQFENKPYRYASYKQEQLVKSNNYQGANTAELIGFLIAINKRIISLIIIQTQESLNYIFVNSLDEEISLTSLIEDYVAHFEYHSRQIMKC